MAFFQNGNFNFLPANLQLALESHLLKCIWPLQSSACLRFSGILSNRILTLLVPAPPHSWALSSPQWYFHKLELSPSQSNMLSTGLHHSLSSCHLPLSQPSFTKICVLNVITTLCTTIPANWGRERARVQLVLSLVQGSLHPVKGDPVSAPTRASSGLLRMPYFWVLKVVQMGFITTFLYMYVKIISYSPLSSPVSPQIITHMLSCYMYIFTYVFKFRST